jgi:CheY-like chemotaxis protein
LLAFSRQQVLHAEPLDINGLIQQMTGMLRRLIGEHIEIKMSLAPDLSMAHADRGQLEQVIMNLVVNARDAMPDGGSVTISTLDVELDERSFPDEAVLPGSYVMLAIADTGTGMGEETHRRLFEPFFTTKEAGKGTGLGLSTTYGIVKQSKGHIGVDTTLGKGTVFKVYLPRAAVSAPAPEEPAKPVARFGHAWETVLLVEDEPAVRRLSLRILENAGYHVLVAANGDEAERLFADAMKLSAPVDLLVTDIIMPHCGGPELFRRLHGKSPNLRVLYMSGYTNQSSAQQAEIDAGLPFVQKPFTATEFEQRVRESLERR